MGDPMELGPDLAVQHPWDGVPISDSDGAWDDLWLAWLYTHRVPGLPARNVAPRR